MIQEIEEMSQSAVVEVFCTMLDFGLQPEPNGTPIRNGEPHIAGSVGFIGKVAGVAYIYCAESFAQFITRKLLRLTDNQPLEPDLVSDAMGELANMVVAKVKSRLTDLGLPCVLTIPSVVRGEHFAVEATGSSMETIQSFRCDPGHQLVLKILVEENPSNDTNHGSKDINH